MDNHVPATSAAASTPSATSIPIPPLPEPTPAPSLQPPSTALQQQPPLSSQPPPSSSSAAPPIPSPSPNPNPNPNPSLRPSTQPPTAANRIPTFNRSWQHPHPHPHPHTHFPQFNSITSSPSSSLSASSGPSLSNSASHSVSAPQQRVGVAIGVPAPHPSPSPSPFSSSFGQQYAGLGRGTINMPDSVPNSSSSQVRGVQGMGMVGSMNSNSTIRPGGIPAHHQQRPLQSSIRPNMPSPNNQSSTTQNFQGHGFMRPSSIGSSGPNTSQSTQSPTQPWLPSGSQGKKPVPSPSFRPQMNTPSLQHRSHVPQRHHSLPTSQQQQHMSLAQQQQPMPSHQPAEHYGQQFLPVRPPRSITEQLSLQASTNSKQPPAPTLPPNPVQPVTQSKAVNVETEEPCNRILSKRSIHDLVSQIDPSEKLDPEVEDILVDIADEFVESITAFGCSLAKHRKSETLEAKDILLHLERNWNMSLPGFSSDEIKTFRKPLINDVHKERLAAIKKSILASEIAGAKITGGQGAGSAKSNMTKTPSNAMIGSNVKVREVT